MHTTLGPYQRLLVKTADGKALSDKAEFFFSENNGHADLDLREPKHRSPILSTLRGALVTVPVLRRILTNHKKLITGLQKELKCSDLAWSKAGLDKKNKYTPLTNGEARLAVKYAKEEQATNERINASKILSHPLACGLDSDSARSRFLAQAFADLCMKMPEYSSGKLEDRHLQMANDEVWDRHMALLNVPGMTAEKLEGILEQVMPIGGNATKRLALAHEAVIRDVLNPHDARDHHEPIATEKSVAYALKFYAEPRELASLLKLVARDGGSGSDKVTRFYEHMKTEQRIKASPKLKPAQKELLLEIGKKQCLDVPLVGQYVLTAAPMIKAMQQPTSEAFDNVEKEFRSGWTWWTVTFEGDGRYASNPAGGDPPEQRFFSECAALAARSMDPLNAKNAAERLAKAMQTWSADDDERARLQARLITAFADYGTKPAVTPAT